MNKNLAFKQHLRNKTKLDTCFSEQSGGPRKSHILGFVLAFAAALFISAIVFGVQTDCPDTVTYVYCGFDN